LEFGGWWIISDRDLLVDSNRITKNNNMDLTTFYVVADIFAIVVFLGLVVVQKIGKRRHGR